MDDHVHVLVEPCGAFRLEQIIHSWKSFSTWQMQRGGQRRGRIWQREYYDRIIREGNDFIEKLNYIIDNPLRRWSAAARYRWVWCSDDAVE